MEPCTKKTYPSRGEALFALARIRSNTHAPGRRVPNGIHPCAACHAWHVTSHAKGKGRRYPTLSRNAC